MGRRRLDVVPMNISVPADLRREMSRHKANWSRVAAEAFDAYLSRQSAAFHRRLECTPTMKTNAYVEYLEGVVLSLLAERGSDEPVLVAGYTAASHSPAAVRERIDNSRRARGRAVEKKSHELSAGDVIVAKRGPNVYKITRIVPGMGFWAA